MGGFLVMAPITPNSVPSLGNRGRLYTISSGWSDYMETRFTKEPYIMPAIFNSNFFKHSRHNIASTDNSATTRYAPSFNND